jgi:PAS domain S-box-containing protein
MIADNLAVDDDALERRSRDLLENQLAAATLCNEIWNAVVQCRDSHDILRRWASALSRHTEYAAVGIWLRTAASAAARLQVVGGMTASDFGSLLTMAQPDVESVLSASKSLVIIDLLTDSRWRDNWPLLQSKRVQAMAIHPLISDGEAVGAVGVFFRGEAGNQPLQRTAIGVNEMSAAFSQLCAQSRWRQANATLGTLMRCAPLGLIELDLRGNIATWSRAAEQMFGWSEIEIRGQPLPVDPSVAYPGYQDWFGAALRGRSTMQVDTRGRRRDGTPVDISVSLAPHYGEGTTVVAVIAIVADISHRKSSEQLLALQQNVSQVLTNSQDLNAAAVGIMESTCHTLGWERGEFWTSDSNSQTLHLAATWGAADSAASPFGTVAKDSLLSDDTCLAVRVYINRALLWLSGILLSHRYDSQAQSEAHPAASGDVVGLPIILADGNVVGVLLFFADRIPEPEKQLQQTLQGMASQIAQYIQRQQTESTLETAEANLRQSQKMEAIGLLAGGVAHDFNNLLTVIIAHSEIGQELLPGHDPLREMLGEIELAGKQAAALTRQLLAFSRKQVVDPIVINLNERVVEMERMLCRLIGKDIELTTCLAPDLYHVRADPAQIEQVLMNLIVNARDAMPQGGKLHIRTANVHRDGAGRQNPVGAATEPYALLQVGDTGCGMDDATRSRIFEPFFTTKEMGKGTGMGLATVYGIVQQCGGDLTVESQLQQGTTFNIYFPRVRDVLLTRQVDAAPQPIPRGTETILVVDDEESVRTVVRAILQVQGYSVALAASGAEALEACRRRRNRPNLILTDVIMPGMSGQQLADRIAARHPDVKLLLMSGYAGDEIRARDRQQAGLAFLHKPFTSEALARKVREVLDD